MTILDGSSQTLFPRVKRLQDPTEAEIEQAVRVLDDAFTGDPFTSILMGGNLDLNPQQLRANVKATLLGGEVHVVVLGDQPSDIVGVALWFPPGAAVYSSEEQRAAGWNQFLEEVPQSLRSWWVDYFVPAMGQAHVEAFVPGYALNSWHLHIFGVMRTHHRKEYGKALVKHVENLAKETHAPLVLETTSEVDVTIYERLGFHVCGETVSIRNSVAGGLDTHLWLMSKET